MKIVLIIMVWVCICSYNKVPSARSILSEISLLKVELEMTLAGWRDDSEVKSTDCFSKDSVLSFVALWSVSLRGTKSRARSNVWVEEMWEL